MTTLTSERPKTGQSWLTSAGKRLLTGAAYLVSIIAVWRLYIVIFNVPVFLLPAPPAVWQALVHLNETGELWIHLAYTIRNILLGFVGGVILGMLLGFALWRSRIFSEAAAPYIVILQAAPKIAIAPLLVLWFGLGLESQLVLILLLSFFPMMIAMELGLRSADKATLELSDLLGMSTWRRFTTVQLPGALPELFSGSKIAIIDAMTGAFLVEYISAQEGLGYLMVLGNSTYNIPLLIAAVLVTVATGLLGFGAIALVERRLLRWRSTT